MIWRLLNALFGCDYVRISYGGGETVQRIKTLPNGTRYVIECNTMFIMKGPICPDGEIIQGNWMVPLTTGATAARSKDQ